jgi:hypothetical protein
MDEYGSAAMLMAVFEAGLTPLVTVMVAKPFGLVAFGVAFFCASAACTLDLIETFLLKKPEPEIGFASTAFTAFGSADFSGTGVSVFAKPLVERFGSSAAFTFDFKATFLSKKPEPETGFASTAFTGAFGNDFSDTGVSVFAKPLFEGFGSTVLIDLVSTGDLLLSNVLSL